MIRIKELLNYTMYLPSRIVNGRDVYIDTLKAIAILLVVIGHCELAYWFGGIPRNVIFSFHMPLFFMASGYMQGRVKKTNIVIKNSVSSLLYPYLIFGFLALLIKHFRADYPLDLAIKVFISGNSAITRSVWFADGHTIGAIWFLIALFWCRTFMALIQNSNSLNKYYMPISGIVSYFSVLLSEYVNLPFGLLTGMSAMVFMAIGIYIRRNGINAIILLLCVGIWFYAVSFIKLDMAGFLYENYIVNILGAIGGTALCMGGAILLYKIPYLRLFRFFGIHSLHVLCWHYVVQAIFPYEMVTGKLPCLLFVIAPFLMSYISVKYKIFNIMFKPLFV